MCEEKNVTVFLRDEDLKSKLVKLSVWKEWGTYYEDEVQARQSLNATFALALCREKGMKWLLHIDSDELFHVSNSNTIHAHFAQLEKDNVMSLTYTNHEGVRALSLCVAPPPHHHVSNNTGTGRFQRRHKHTTRLLSYDYSVSKTFLEPSNELSSQRLHEVVGTKNKTRTIFFSIRQRQERDESVG